MPWAFYLRGYGTHRYSTLRARSEARASPDAGTSSSRSGTNTRPRGLAEGEIHRLMAGCDRQLRSDLILAFDQAARIVLSRDVLEPDVAQQRAEQRYAVSNEYRDASKYEALDQPGA